MKRRRRNRQDRRVQFDPIGRDALAFLPDDVLAGMAPEARRIAAEVRAELAGTGGAPELEEAA